MTVLWSVPLWFVLTGAGLIATVLPRRFEIWAGPLFGRFVLATGLFRHRIAEDNIRRCLPELGEKGARKLLRKNFEHYGILFFEFLHFFSPIPGHWRRYVERNYLVEDFHNWEQAHAKGKGVLFVTAHVGAWELMASGGALAGIPITIVTKKLKPKWLQWKMTSARRSAGVEMAYHPGSMPKILRALRRGASVGFMNDQYARPPMGVPVEFFGVQVDTLAALGPLSKRTGAPVIPVHTVRRKDGKARIIFEPMMDLGEAAGDPEASTQIMARKVEGWVRAKPEQWLWIHRRFKNVDWSKRPSGQT